MSDIGVGMGAAFAIMGSALVIGGGVVVAGISYSANKYYFEPNARKVEFNARAQDALSVRRLKAISVSDFKEAANGCAKPLYGATFAAQNARGQVVRGTMCVSRSTEMNIRFKV